MVPVLEAIRDGKIARARGRLAGALTGFENRTQTTGITPTEMEVVLFAYDQLAPFLALKVEKPDRYSRSENRMAREQVEAIVLQSDFVDDLSDQISLLKSITLRWKGHQVTLSLHEDTLRGIEEIDFAGGIISYDIHLDGNFKGSVAVQLERDGKSLPVSWFGESCSG